MIRVSILCFSTIMFVAIIFHKTKRYINHCELTHEEHELEKAMRPLDRSLSNNINSITCDVARNYLIGQIKVNLTVPKDLKAVEDFLASPNLFSGIQPGGLWKPKDCRSKTKTAIILPFRKRAEQLRVIIKHLHPILQRQLIHYRIFVIEQAGEEPFNKGRLLNSAYKEILKFDNFDCYVFNDIDMFVKNGWLLHDCPISPYHMSSKIDQSRLVPPSLFGGVIALWRKHFEHINGYSNLYWKWGGEDDDMFWRLNGKRYHVVRPPPKVGRYIMMKEHHFRSDKRNIANVLLVKKVQQQSLALYKNMSDDKWIYAEGLNTVRYNLRNVTEYPLYTFISVSLPR